MEKFQLKYRIESARVQTWDYSSQGAYFITINAGFRESHLGCVDTLFDGLIRLSQVGEIVKEEWLETPQIRPDMHLILDDFVIMPDHFHAILFIGENEFNKERKAEILNHRQRDAMHRVFTTSAFDPTENVFAPPATNHFGPQSKNLASVIRGFKSSVTTRVRKMGDKKFSWQSRFHDRILRDEAELWGARKYIQQNPAKWVSNMTHD